MSIYSYKTIKKYTIINFDHEVNDGLSTHLQCTNKKATDNLKNHNLPNKYYRCRESLVAKMNSICKVGWR